MADWYGACRSNYFLVKDAAAFEAFCGHFDAQVITNVVGDEILYGFYSTDYYGSIPTRFFDNDDQVDSEGDTISILDGIAEHLAENEVCVVLEAGAEKARYITGTAIAISWANERTQINLSDIYAQAQDKFGGDANITQAVY